MSTNAPAALLERLGSRAPEAVVAASAVLVLVGVVATALGQVRVGIVVVLVLQLGLVGLVLLTRRGLRASHTTLVRLVQRAQEQNVVAQEQSVAEAARTRHALLSALEELVAERGR